MNDRLIPLDEALDLEPSEREGNEAARGTRPKPNGGEAPAGASAAESYDEIVARAVPIERDEPVPELPVVTVSSLAGKPTPPRRWHVPDMIPGRTVTLLGGDGGVGKSIVAKQLGVATAAGKPWFGTSPEQGPVVYLSAEDDIDELQRRLEDIAASYGVDLADLEGLHFVSLAGRDAVMAAPSGKPGIIAATVVWRGLLVVVERLKPCLLILDTLADVFAGNENARAEARQFIGLLRGLAISHDLAVLLLAHPSLFGLSSGSGTSGSTAWNNSVRSRIYLETIKGDDGREIDADLRVLRVMKSNYGRAGLEMRLRWSSGCFVLDGPAGGFDKLAADAKAECVFLDLLATYAAQGRDVSDSPGSNYAPAEFAGQAGEAVTKTALHAAMKRLLRKHSRGQSRHAAWVVRSSVT